MLRNVIFCLIFVDFLTLTKGATSPDIRGVSQGVFPIQAIKSDVVDQDDVSCRWRLTKLSDFVLLLHDFWFILRTIQISPRFQ